MNTKEVCVSDRISTVEFQTSDETTILIVDEDLSVRTLVGSVLRDYGFQILTATGMEDAIHKINCGSHKIHLLISNVTLQDGDGFALSDKIQKRHPYLKTLFMSGFTTTSVGAIRGETFIRKPFLVSEMREKVKEILGVSHLGLLPQA